MNFMEAMDAVSQIGLSFKGGSVRNMPPCKKCGKECDGTEKFWVARDLSEAECDACHPFHAPGVEGFEQE